MEVTGKVGGISYTIDQSIVDRLKAEHGIDAVKEIEQALKKENQQYEDQSIKGQSPSK